MGTDTTDTAEKKARSGRWNGRFGRVRVLVLRSGALGDFVLTLPVLAGIRRAFPRAEVTLVTRSEFGRLARVIGLAERIVSEDSPEVVWLYSDSGEGGRAPAPAGKLRRSPAAAGLSNGGRAFGEAHGAFDLALSFVLSPDVRRNLLAAGVAALSARSPRPHPSSGLHAADHLLAVMNGLGRAEGPAVPRLALGEEDRARAEADLREHGLAAGRYLALHPGSGSPRKNWPLGRFVELARRAREQLRLKVVLLTGPVEAEEGQRGEIEAAFDGVADAFLCAPDLVTLAGVLAASAAYVGNDSGVTHLAAAASSGQCRRPDSCCVAGYFAEQDRAAGARVVAVFGPTDPGVWAPRGERVAVVRHESGEIERVGVEEVVSLLCG